MDKSWISSPRTSIQYVNGVEGFLTHCQTVCENENEIHCPCVKCGNYYPKVNICTLRDHLIINGIDKSYIHWSHMVKVISQRERVTWWLKRMMYMLMLHISEMVDDLQDELVDNPEGL